MKTCFICGEGKPLSDFYKHPMMADGHLNKCKPCTRAYIRKHRAENDHVREYDRRRYHEHPGRKEASQKRVKTWRERYPEKYKAHNAVSNAIRDGKLERGSECEECGSIVGLHAHHDDYSKPLEVRWRCVRCHQIGHARQNDLESTV